MTKVEEVFQDLEKKIISLEYEPGQVITEQEISKTYDISRTPCRDVFQKLKSNGLIESIPFKSNTISLLDYEQIKQKIYVRTAVEYMIIKDLMENITDEVILELEYNLKLQEMLLKKDFQTKDFYELDYKFHHIFFKATKKEYIWEEIQKSHAQYTRFRMLDIIVVQKFREIYENHLNLFDIIKNKRFDELEKAIKGHLNSGISRLKDKISTEYSHYFKNNRARK